MSKANISKKASQKEFIDLYTLLPYDYKNIVLNTARCLATCKKEPPPSGFYDITKTIKTHQKELKYKNQKVCDKVNAILEQENSNSDRLLSVETFCTIKKRNTQTSQQGTNWLKYIAQVLKFEEDEYQKHLTKEGANYYENAFSRQFFKTNSIDTLYDLLSKKEKSAILQLTVSLLKLSAAPEYNTE